MGGRRPALEAVRSGRAREVLVSRSAHSTPGLRELIDEAARAGVAVRRVDPDVVERLGGPDHHGVAARVAPAPDLGERELSAFPFGSGDVVVVLDGITDPQNFGACARSAEAAGAVLLVTRKRRAAPLTAAAMRSSSGALLHLPVARVANIPRALELLKDAGFSVIGLDPDGMSMWTAPAADRPVALVLGAEGEGLSRLVREHCDLLVSIPLTGRTSSLNASAALSVGLFAYVMRPDRPGPAATMPEDAGVAQPGSASDL